MDQVEAHFRIKKSLQKCGFTACRPLPRNCVGPDVYDGTIQVGHRRIDVRLDVPDFLLVSRPRVFLRDRSQINADILAHIETETGICYAADGFLRLDPWDPGGSVLRVLEEARTTLERSLKGRGAEEIAFEYHAYWGPQIFTLLPRDAAGPAVLAEPVGEVSNTAGLLVNAKRRPPPGYRRGPRIRIYSKSTGGLRPTAGVIAPRTLAELEVWFAAQELDGVVSWTEFRSRLGRGELSFIAGENAWLGVQLEPPARLTALKSRQQLRPKLVDHWMNAHPAEFGVRRMSAADASLDYIVERNLEKNSASLRTKKVCLIGCGTIGSHLARMLVQMGAGFDGELTLVDNQRLAPGNLGRHLLSFEHLGVNKAEALAAELSRFHPDVRVLSRNADATSMLSSLSRFDLIVDAAGVEVLSEALNAHALAEWRAGRSFELVHAWLFGNGIAAQVFGNFGGGYACYRCLRPDLTQPWRVDPRKDVSQTGDVSRGGCGDGSYLPYATYAPVFAASLAGQLIHDWCNGRRDPRLRTLVIDSERAKRCPNRSLERDEDCPACRA